MSSLSERIAAAQEMRRLAAQMMDNFSRAHQAAVESIGAALNALGVPEFTDSLEELRNLADEGSTRSSTLHAQVEELIDILRS